MKSEERLWYVRYADDMIFAIQGGDDSESVYQRFQKGFHRALDELKLEATSFTFIRGKSRPCGTRILGLNVYIHKKGQLEIKAPFDRWKKK
jgi:hypothetical protein